MVRIDGLKEEIGFFKLWLGVAMATFITLTGWLATNYNKADNWLLFSASICDLIFGLLIIALSVIIKAKIEQIKRI